MEKLQPTLRFPEFKDDWNLKKIDEISLKVNSGKTPLGGESVYVENGVLFIRSQNVIDNKLSFENSTFIPEQVNNTMKNSIVKPNDLLLNITGASLGRSCVVPSDFNIGNVNQHVCIIRFKNDNNPRFIQPIFASEKGQNLFLSLQTGSGREGLNFQSIKGIKLAIPSNEEQTKIANFLTAVDQKINQLTQKAALLAQYKKGVMQQLFSQQLRFKDENGNPYPDWEEKTLGDFLSIPNKVKPDEIDKTKLLTVKLHLKGILKNESTDGLTIGATNYYVRNKGQFIYGKQNIFNGAFGIIPDEFDGHLSSGDVPTLDINHQKIKPGFLLNYLGRESYYKKLEDIASGSGSKRIHESNLLSVSINLPCMEEQTKIANFLSAIDDKINHVNTQLDKTKTFKKGLLQQMFV